MPYQVLPCHIASIPRISISLGHNYLSINTDWSHQFITDNQLIHDTVYYPPLQHVHTHRRAINYPPRGIGAVTQKTFFGIHDSLISDPSPDLTLSTPILELLFLVGSVAERKADKKKSGSGKAAAKGAESKNTEKKEEGVGDEDSYSNQDDDLEFSRYIHSKYKKEEEEKKAFESFTPRQLKTLSDASKYVEV